ncbi:hypothetical protein CGRA01v4_06130 [Colletotrichum graminicola]|uniref:Glycosyl hydrolase family 32 n=1 Tax=Colletotrichum graminicola (strain M1.001 / M2 / FGSC 10212) TaxID=645133 RepID=E3QZ80_COLGM|nr:uncharacterized protein GLRG_11332 [Colletotrichum graminicola M1.001]EFQ36168.1 hypothetical protein GLRG_11332 [Colletotrichum graminicola M1.001]WDK14849.1 hypothetical protein CGRA01v4_06130 [Colletotrichum graminicola]
MALLNGGAVFAIITSLAAIAVPVAGDIPAIITPKYIATAGNSSLFTRWRPYSHFIAPHSWMNDPCGAVYDPTTNTYHLQYQWHPNHVAWGNISWGHAISSDLFHWFDIHDWVNDSSVSLAAHKYPAAPLAIFSGTTRPVNVKGVQDGTLLTFATGIHALPSKWKRPYALNTEVQALFTSTDAGKTWDEFGTVISSPPDGWNVTGWRDPSFFLSEELDSLRRVNKPHYYMTLGSGLKSGNVPISFPDAARPGFIGPRIPLYSAPASDLTQWTFLGALWEPAANESLGNPDVTGSWGYNFETSSFFNLPIGKTGKKAWFVTMGTEGGNTTMHSHKHWALWNRGDVARRANGSVEFIPNSGSALDWGRTYSHITWEDTKHHSRRIVWGWVGEDFVPEYAMKMAKKFGYQGAITMPQELYVQEIKGVQNCGTQRDASVCVKNSQTGAIAQTLGIRPLPDVLELLRRGAQSKEFKVGQLTDATKHVSANVGTSYELYATLSSFRGSAGIIIGQSPDNAEHTTIVFDADASQIRVVRRHSSLLPYFDKDTHIGHFKPYIIRQPGSRESKVEDINFHLILDGSLLEIWVNDRFALATRIYPSRSDSTGLSFFVGNAAAPTGGTATWTHVKAWIGLAKAWPKRPHDTSVPLVWDTPEETNNYKWWDGW